MCDANQRDVGTVLSNVDRIDFRSLGDAIKFARDLGMGGRIAFPIYWLGVTHAVWFPPGVVPTEIMMHLKKSQRPFPYELGPWTHFIREEELAT